LVEHWNGGVWRTMPNPQLSPGSELDGISGLTEGDIWAVGYETNQSGGSRGLVEHWNGSAWSVVTSPQSDPTTSSVLESVAAISPSNVWAVGSDDGNVGLIEHWNGHAWVTVRNPLDHSHLTSDLHALATVSPSDIWAVGQGPPGGNQAVAEHWNGRSWRVVPARPLGSQGSSAFNSVAAVSSKGVWAVGDELNGVDRERRLIEHWNGRQWQVFRGVAPGPSHNDLLGVAALSTTAVWAVGTVGPGPTGLYDEPGSDGLTPVGVTLTGRWNGRNWKPVPSPNPTGASAELDAVDYLSVSNAWAVGYRLADGYVQGLAEHWNGSDWSVVPTPQISGRNAYLSATEALAPNDVWAVGWTATAANADSHRLIEHWNGRRWSIIPGANGAPHGELVGVSADSRGDLWAAGYAKRNGGAAAPFVERWDGDHWKRVPNPARMHQAGAIAVVSAHDVWVSSGGGERLDHWNGNRWTSFSMGNSHNYPFREVYALAASPSHDVWGAGYTIRGPDISDVPLAEHWNGAAWHVVRSAHHWPGIATEFSAIADITPSNIWAVGTFAGDARMLAEHWNGTAFRVVPTASGIRDGSLLGVDGSPRLLWAVGSYSGDGALIPVAERYVPC
jgi:hypothetical protein